MSSVEIVESLGSLYPLKDFEEEAVMEVVSEFRELKEKELSGLELAKIVCSMEKLKKYEAIGTLEECEKAMKEYRQREETMHRLVMQAMFE